MLDAILIIMNKLFLLEPEANTRESQDVSAQRGESRCFRTIESVIN